MTDEQLFRAKGPLLYCALPGYTTVLSLLLIAGMVYAHFFWRGTASGGRDAGAVNSIGGGRDMAKAKAVRKKSANSAHGKTAATGAKGKDTRPERDESGEPWSHLIAAAGEPPPFLETCFDDFPDDQIGMDEKPLKRWLAPVASAPAHVRPQRGGSPIVEGLAKLRATWRKDFALRFSIHSFSEFHIYVYSGADGVALCCHPDRGLAWAAYRVTRDDGQPRPKSWSLVASDNDRYRRLGAGTIELHYQPGELILTRGNVRLLTAPLGDTPTDVFFDGRGAWRGIELFRCGPVPPVAKPRPLYLLAEKPAAMKWKQDLPRGARLEPLADGRLRLASQKTSTLSKATLPLPQRGLYEVIAKLDDYEPGAGVFLGDERGEPIAGLGFYRDKATNASVLDYARGDGNDTVNLPPRNQQPTALAHGPVWLRLVLGTGTFKGFVSGDGRHWGRLPQPPQRNVQSGFASIGLFCQPGQSSRRITLERLEVRELSALTSLAPAEVRQQAQAFADAADLPSWLQAVAESQPTGVDSDAWRRACAMKTLTATPPLPLAEELLHSLVSDGLRDDTPEARLALLDEAALVADTYDANKAKRWLEHYYRFAEDLRQDEAGQLFDGLTRALLAPPIWGPPQTPLGPREAIHRQLLGHVYHSRWHQLLTLHHQLQYFNRTSDLKRRRYPTGREDLAPLLDWSATLAARAAPEEARRRGVAINSKKWRHPLFERLDKEAFNVLAELDAALDGAAFEDAAQIIANTNARRVLGLLPAAKDQRLLVSFPSAVGLAMQQYPALRQAMRDKYGELGTLRVRELMTRGDQEAVEAATVQLYGTPAAAEAHRWLGDRALSGGDPQRAMIHYRLAAKDAPLGSEQAIAARLRLAAAMTGHRAGEPVGDSVEFGGMRLSPDEFEKLVTGEFARHKSLGPPAGVAAQATSVPPAAAYELRPWGMARSNGRDANNAPRRLLLADGLLLLSDCYAVTAFDLAGKKQLWQTRTSLHRFPGMSPRPAVAGDRVFFRSLIRNEPILICVNRQGTQQWRTKPGVPIVSHPLLLDGRLFAFSYRTTYQSTLELYWLQIDPNTGQIEQERPFVELDSSAGRPLVEAVNVGDGIIAAFNGCVLRCDAAGAANWVRRQTLLPSQFNPSHVYQDVQPPLVHGGRVYVSQRGVRAVDCLDRETGRLFWSFSHPKLRRAAAATEGRAFVETEDGVIALDADDGSPLWQDAGEGPRQVLAAADDAVFIARALRLESNSWRLELAWLDAARGTTRASWPLNDVNATMPSVGPLVQHGDRQLVLFGDTRRSAQSLIMELVKQEPARSHGAPDARLLEWLPQDRSVFMSHQTAAALPSWTLLSCGRDKLTRLHAKLEGQSNVLVTLADGARPVRLMNQVRVPDQSCKLIIHVGHTAKERWSLEIRAAGKSLLRQDIDKTTAPSSWLRREIDLTPYAGQTLWLTATHHSPTGKDTHALWREMRIVE